MDENKISVLSEKDPIQCWLDTPMGYYVGLGDWGNNLHMLLFKNREFLQMNLNIILDKIREDLGDDIANDIIEIGAFKTDIDELVIAILYGQGQIAFTKVNERNL